MENYKKKYEQALERAKFYCGRGKNLEFDAPDIAFDIFPELKESEDDVMRKMAIKAVYAPEAQSCIKSWGVEPKDVITWLEKQGEQKPTDNLMWNELTWEDVNTIEEIINEVHSDFRNGIGAESFGEEVLERFREIKGDEYMDTCEQKPAWSEEDEKQARQIERIVHDNGCTHKLQKQIADWLKSLKERYAWKPSDYQLEALESATENCAYSEYQDCLRDLIKQLKKLMEG